MGAEGCERAHFGVSWRLGGSAPVSITVARSTVRSIVASPDWITIQVQRASDPQAAAEALALAAGDICALAHAKYVSAVTETGTGPLIFIDAVGTPRQLLVQIPDVVVARLQERGVADATVASPQARGPLFNMFDPAGPGLPRAVTLMLYLPPPANRAEWQGPRPRIPDSWLAEAAAWLRGGASGNAGVHGRVVNVEFPVGISDAEAVLRRAADRRDSLELVAGTVAQPIRRAVVDARLLPHVALSGGGPAADDDELVATAEALVDVARRRAGDVSYATLSIDPVFSTRPTSDWWRHHDGERWDLAEELCDEYVVDAFPYQVLGPGHRARLGGTLGETESLANGRIGLAIGELADWLVAPLEDPYKAYPASSFLCERRRDPNVTEKGRQLLARCLLRRDEGKSLLSTRHNA